MVFLGFGVWDGRGGEAGEGGTGGWMVFFRVWGLGFGMGGEEREGRACNCTVSFAQLVMVIQGIGHIAQC